MVFINIDLLLFHSTFAPTTVKTPYLKRPYLYLCRRALLKKRVWRHGSIQLNVPAEILHISIQTYFLLRKRKSSLFLSPHGHHFTKPARQKTLKYKNPSFSHVCLPQTTLTTTFHGRPSTAFAGQPRGWRGRDCGLCPATTCFNCICWSH